jgi:predicted nucleotidyltransferase/HEPN domain-containing protein
MVLLSRAMRSDLDHLPAAKRQELAAIASILFEEFSASLSGRNAPRRSTGRILKLVLFGSYARGDWVADPVGGYYSDYDLLVVVNDEQLSDVVEYWSGAEATLVREVEAGTRIRTPVSFIVHGIADLNRQLRRGRPFFRNIVRDGVVLFEMPGHPLEQAADLTADEAATEARQHFDEWFPSAEKFVRAGDFLRADGAPKEAAFQYHQATERLYHCVLLVLTLYSPKSHKLNMLRSQAEQLAPGLAEAWPRGTRFAQRAFELLRRAYVEARYSPHYRITLAELDWLADRVAVLRDLVRKLCDEKLQR